MINMKNFVAYTLCVYKTVANNRTIGRCCIDSARFIYCEKPRRFSNIQQKWKITNVLRPIYDKNMHSKRIVYAIAFTI